MILPPSALIPLITFGLVPAGDETIVILDVDADTDNPDGLVEEPFGADTELVHVVDMFDRVRRDLPSAYWDKPRMVAVAQGFGDACQVAEDLNFALIVDRGLAAARGVHLDRWGALVGEARGGLVDDADYRRFIEARFLANNGPGDNATSIAIFGIVTAPSVVEHRPLVPAGSQFTAFRQAPMSPEVRRRVHRIMMDAKPMGVTWALIEAVPSWFGFEERRAADPGGPSTGLDTGRLSGVI